MSNLATENYAHNSLVDGLKLASDSAIGLGLGNRNEGESSMHAKFLRGLQQAEEAARMIAHSRGERRGYAWLKLAMRLGKMLEAGKKSAQLSIIHSAAGVKNAPRGPIWVRLGQGLGVIASDCRKATEQGSDKDLIIGGLEYEN